MGYNSLNNSSDNDIKSLIAKLKSEGKHKEIEKAIKVLKNTKRTNIPKDLCYVEGENFDNYIHDIKIVQHFARWNRAAIGHEIIKNMKLSIKDSFETIHNYIDTENMILRKGSISAKDGEKVLIPLNMRDGSLICVGKGNRDWNYSAPHGAGRILSRSAAKEKLNLEDFKESMKDVYSSCVSKETIDESPAVYKNAEEIKELIEPTVEIIKEIKPVYNFKASN